MILYFTGTGNSRHLAAMLPQLIGDEDIMDMTAMNTVLIIQRSAAGAVGPMEK